MGVIFYSILYGTLPFGERLIILYGSYASHLETIMKLDVPKREED
jgi:hypothetical protein